MKKIINIDGRDVAFEVNGALPLRFMQETGKDLFEIAIPFINALMPAVKGLAPVVLSKPKNKSEKDILNAHLGEILESIDFETLLYKFSALDVMTLVYVMAKEANKDINPDMAEWYADFDTLPAYKILKELIPLIIETFGSKVQPKNVEAAAGAK